MFGYKRIIISDHERGLKFKEGNLVAILVPGIYELLDPLGRVSVTKYDISSPEFHYEYEDVLLKEKPELVEKHFQVVELKDYELGLVYKNGKLDNVLTPTSRSLYWLGPIDVKVEKVNIKLDFLLPKSLAGIIAHSNGRQISSIVNNYIKMLEVVDNHLGLLIVDGELKQTLKPGLHAYWKFNRNIKIEVADLRLQVMEVQGQEILTKDKVSLRVNLSAQYKISDIVVARSKLANVADTLYRELQFAIRQAIAGRTLDSLLANKDELDKEIFQSVRHKVKEYGIDVASVGVKDVILPGDMKEILNQVVEAEKVAQANVIKRREETAATRSLLNTAKLMENNPTLMRLKELEVLEKVTEKVDTLTVFGGLDGVLNDTVKLNLNKSL